MFFPHLIAVFTNQQVGHVLSRYIPKRYTMDLREYTAFDRYDKMFAKLDGDTKASRMIELLPDWCALQRSSVMSK